MTKCSGCMTQCQECSYVEIADVYVTQEQIDNATPVTDKDYADSMEELFNEVNNEIGDILNSLLHLNNEYVKIIANKEGVFALLEDNSIFCIYEYERESE